MDESTIGTATARRKAMRAIGATGLAALGAFGLADASAKKQKRKKNKVKVSRGSTFATRVAIGEFSDPLPIATGSLAQASADCGGAGKVISCGYGLNAPNESGLNTAVLAVAPTGDLASCTAILVRTTDTGSTAGARIQAVAICLE